MRILDEKKLRENIVNTVRSDIESGKIGGVAVAVMQEGNTVYQDYFKNERLGIEVSESTLFRMASMTKPITAAATFLLVDRGELDLDMPVSYFIPQFERMNVGRVEEGKLKIVDYAKTTITIRHLLTHTSGLGDGPVEKYLGAILPANERKTLKQVVNFYAENPLEFEPGTRQAYSGTHAFDVLAHIIEIVSGTSYEKFLKKEIFAPLGMVDTTFSPTIEQWQRMIPMHAFGDGVGRIVKFPENSIFQGIPVTCFSGGAGLASTLKDYKKFANLLLNYGWAENRQLISKKMIREMSTPQLSADVMCGQEVWGLGVRVIVDKLYGNLPCGTFGWSGTYGTHFWVDPENRVIAIYLRNSMDAGGAGAETARYFEKDVNASYI